MDKHILLYLHNGILHSNEKEQAIDSNMNQQ